MMERKEEEDEEVRGDGGEALKMVVVALNEEDAVEVPLTMI